MVARVGSFGTTKLSGGPPTHGAPRTFISAAKQTFISDRFLSDRVVIAVQFVRQSGCLAYRSAITAGPLNQRHIDDNTRRFEREVAIINRLGDLSCGF